MFITLKPGASEKITQLSCCSPTAKTHASRDRIFLSSCSGYQSRRSATKANTSTRWYSTDQMSSIPGSEVNGQLQKDQKLKDLKLITATGCSRMWWSTGRKAASRHATQQVDSALYSAFVKGRSRSVHRTQTISMCFGTSGTISRSDCARQDLCDRCAP